MKPKTGVLGLGIIGSIWARHLEADGLLAGSWNRTPRPELPCFLPTPGDVAERADCLIVVVADPPAVTEVLEALQPRLDARHLVIQSSTIGPQHTGIFRDLVASRGARYLEAPFTGSRPAAEARKLVYYIGDDMDCAAEAEPVLSRLSAARLPCGSNVQACSVKLAMNLQIAAQAEALCEALSVCRRAGVDDDVFFGCMQRNVCWSGLAALKEPKLRGGDYAPQFSIKHMLKDMRLLREAAGALPVLQILNESLAGIAETGRGDDDFIALYRAFEEDAGRSG